MKKKINALKSDRTGLIDKAQAAIEAGDQDTYASIMDEIEGLNVEIDALEKLAGERGRYSREDDKATMIKDSMASEDKDAVEIRSSNEYKRAWAKALRMGISPESPYNEEFAPLYAVLKTTGGDPEGSDGGFLVPTDVQARIMRYRDNNVRLADYVTHEYTNNYFTGSRVKDEAPTAGFTKFAENEEVPKDDQPKFSRIEYALEKFGLIVPITYELLRGSVESLENYIVEWFGKKMVITQNKLILDELATLTATDIAAGEEFKAIDRALLKDLTGSDAAFAKMLMNRTAFYDLFSVDANSENRRPRIQEDLTKPATFNIVGREAITIDDVFLPAADGKNKVYIGDLKRAIALLQLETLRIDMTRVGGNAWGRDGAELRAIAHMDAVKAYEDAVKAYTLAEAPEV